MRQLGIFPSQVAEVVRSPAYRERDENGNERFYGAVGGRHVRVVVASDDPTFVKTVHERKPW